MLFGRRPLDYLQTRASPLRVWAIEDTSIQVMWGDLPAGSVTIEADDSGTTIEHPGGAGGITVNDLPPDSAVTLRLTTPSGDHLLSSHTLPTPAGELLAEVATVSDLHLVEYSWGALKTMYEIEPSLDPYSMRCARSAISEAQSWGAEHLVIKGDAAHHRNPHSYEQLGVLVDEFPSLAMTLIPGNHDVDRHGDIPLPESVGARSLPYSRGVTSFDIGGANFLAVDTTIEGYSYGTIRNLTDAVVESLTPGRPSVAFLHHHLQVKSYPRFWPRGIPGPEADAFLDSVRKANPRTLITSGHTHRNRRRDVGSTVLTEVASTKDWPGVWAGYAVHEGGIRQVVRRVEEPSAARWHEYSRHAVFSLWSRWSPGPINERCFTHNWV